MLGHLGGESEIRWIAERVEPHRKLLGRIQGFLIIQHVE
jgi:hypothetical protein